MMGNDGHAIASNGDGEDCIIDEEGLIIDEEGCFI